jgi:hypothetical protein
MSNEVKIKLTDAQKAKIKEATGKDLPEIRVETFGSSPALSGHAASTRASNRAATKASLRAGTRAATKASLRAGTKAATKASMRAGTKAATKAAMRSSLRSSV